MIRELAYSPRGLAHEHRDRKHDNRQADMVGTGWRIYILTCRQVSRQKETKRLTWFELLKPQIPPPVTHLLQEAIPPPTSSHLQILPK